MRDSVPDEEIIELSPDDYELVEEEEKPRSRPPPLPAKKQEEHRKQA